MSYAEWVEMHAKKHAELIQKLKQKNLTKEQIISYFDFKNMCENERSFCELYEKHQPCHSMKRLNCYLCACPFFRFYLTPKIFEGKKLYSDCIIHSKNGSKSIYGDAIHHDCSRCIVPHTHAFIRKHYKTCWKSIMQPCETD